MKGSDMHLPETYTFDFAKRRFPYWFRPEDSTRQAAVVSYMHAHQLTLTRVYAKTGCSRHFCNYRFTAYDDPAAIPGPVSNCAWIDVGGAEPGCRLPHGFVYRPGRAIPILQSAFDRVPDPSQPIGRDPVPSPRFSGGSGTPDDPYRISSPEELLLLSYLSNHRVYSGIDPTLVEEIGDNFPEWCRGKHFRLTRDLVWNDPACDPADRVSFPIICNRNGGWGRSAHFSGVFDGAGHFLRGLYVTEEEEKKRYPSGEYAFNNGVSLFGALHGTVKNLAITDSVFTGSARVAAIAGVLAFGGAVENCTILANTAVVAGGLYQSSGSTANSVVYYNDPDDIECDGTELWCKDESPNYRVQTGLDNDTRTSGYWFPYTDSIEGGASTIEWPVARGTEFDPYAFDNIVRECNGLCGTIALDAGEMDGINPYAGVYFNIVGETSVTDGTIAVGDVTAWEGICITYTSTLPAKLVMELDEYTRIAVNEDQPVKNLAKAALANDVCIEWSDFRQSGWGKADKISGTEAATKLAALKFEISATDGSTGDFNIIRLRKYSDVN